MPFDHTKLAAARLRAAGLQPFLAIALYALSPVADCNKPTFAVDDRWRLSVNPVKLADWSVLEVAGVLLHEVGHVVRDHSGRAQACTDASEVARHRWNVAADAEINDDLVTADIALPETPVTPRSLGLPPNKVALGHASAQEQRLGLGQARGQRPDVTGPQGSGVFLTMAPAPAVDPRVRGRRGRPARWRMDALGRGDASAAT